jgi:hypothetical protein
VGGPLPPAPLRAPAWRAVRPIGRGPGCSGPCRRPWHRLSPQRLACSCRGRPFRRRSPHDRPIAWPPPPARRSPVPARPAPCHAIRSPGAAARRSRWTRSGTGPGVRPGLRRRGLRPSRGPRRPRGRWTPRSTPVPAPASRGTRIWWRPSRPGRVHRTPGASGGPPRPRPDRPARLRPRTRSHLSPGFRVRTRLSSGLRSSWPGRCIRSGSACPGRPAHVGWFFSAPVG